MNNRKLTMSLALAALLGIGLASPAMADGKRYGHERDIDRGHQAYRHERFDDRRHATRHDGYRDGHGHDRYAYRDGHGHGRYAYRDHPVHVFKHRHARVACQHWSHRPHVHPGYRDAGLHIVIRGDNFGLRF